MYDCILKFVVFCQRGLYLRCQIFAVTKKVCIVREGKATTLKINK